jgi:hypothetical protein
MFFKKDRMKRLNLLILSLIVLLAISCSKKGDFPSVPDITFKSIGPSVVRTGDSISIVLGFKDKEGDINGDTVFFRASNSSVFGSYRIPEFPAQHNLEGNIILILQNNDFADPNSAGGIDTIYFDLYIKDLHGHLSDTVQTSPVVVYQG